MKEELFKEFTNKSKINSIKNCLMKYNVDDEKIDKIVDKIDLQKQYTIKVLNKDGLNAFNEFIGYAAEDAGLYKNNSRINTYVFLTCQQIGIDNANNVISTYSINEDSDFMVILVSRYRVVNETNGKDQVNISNYIIIYDRDNPSSFIDNNIDFDTIFKI